MAKRKSKENEDLKKVQAQFRVWRKNRKAGDRIPDSLWDAAASLCGSLSINELSKALGVNHTALKNRIEENDNRLQSAPQQAAFIEYPPLGSPALCTELNLDIEKADLKIKFQLKVPVNAFSAGGQRP